jgi:hypothetical protein
MVPPRADIVALTILAVEMSRQQYMSIYALEGLLGELTVVVFLYRATGVSATSICDIVTIISTKYTSIDEDGTVDVARLIFGGSVGNLWLVCAFRESARSRSIGPCVPRSPNPIRDHPIFSRSIWWGGR